MFCNDLGIELIKSFEGLSLTSYQDQGGRWTIGFGTAHPWVTEGLTCTEVMADAWLTQDVQNVASALSRMIKVPVNENQFSALCSLCYNIGQGNMAKSSALAVLNTGDVEDVPPHMEMWCKVNGEDNTGLIRRRAAEVALFLTEP